MARSLHSAPRHMGKVRNKRSRSDFRSQVARGDFDGMMSTMPTRAIRTGVAL